MKKSTKKFTGSMAALATVASIVAPAAVVIAAEQTAAEKAENLVSYAEKTLNFFDFNMALHEVISLPEKNTTYWGLLARLDKIAAQAKTPDVAAVLEAMDNFGPNRDLTNFYAVYDLVNQVKEEKNRLYLQNELNTWGKASVFTPEVVAATDAVIKAWSTKDPEDVDSALGAIANVTLAGNISWLEAQVSQVRNTIGMRVQSVKALNASEIQVKFTRNVDEESVKANDGLDLANFVFTVNNVKYGVGYANNTSELIDLENIDDSINVNGNVVTFKLHVPVTTDADHLYTENFNMHNGDKYSVDVKDGVLTADLSAKVAKFGDTQHIFTDYVAPKLLSASLTGDKKLQLEFDEPVSLLAEEGSNTEFVVTVDGKEVFFEADDAINANRTVLDYTVTSVDNAPATVGVHNVVVYNVRDAVLNNGNFGNKAPLLTTSYEVKAGQAPYVKSVTPVDFNCLDVNFSEPVKNAKIVVKKGNVEFFNAVVLQDAASSSYHVVLPDSASTVRYGVTDLYNDESSIGLTVSVTEYKDTDKLIGNAYNTSVTLKRDAKKPQVISKYNNKVTTIADEGALLVPFNRSGIILTSASKVTVTDRLGVVRTALVQSTGDGLSVKIYNDKINKDRFLSQGELNGLAPFTVSVGAGAVKVKTDLFEIENYYSSSLSNVAETTTVLANDSFEFVAKEAVESVAINKDNVITVTYKEAMSPSAAKLANYTLDGFVMPTGTTISMSGDSKIVRITLPGETYATNVKKKLVVNKDVTTATGSYVVGDIATKEEYRSDLLQIRDNVSPTLVKAEYIVSDASNPKATRFIKLTFSEKLANVVDDTNDFAVTVNGVTQVVENVYDYATGDNTVTLTLSEKVNPAQAATVKIAGTADIEDFAGNTARVGSTITTTGNIQFVAPLIVPTNWLDLNDQVLN